MCLETDPEGSQESRKAAEPTDSTELGDWGSYTICLNLGECSLGRAAGRYVHAHWIINVWLEHLFFENGLSVERDGHAFPWGSAWKALVRSGQDWAAWGWKPLNGPKFMVSAPKTVRKATDWEILVHRWRYFFFFLFFLGHTCGIWKYPGKGSNQSCSHSNTRSLIHWAKPGIEPVSSWILVVFVSTVP